MKSRFRFIFYGIVVVLIGWIIWSQFLSEPSDHMERTIDVNGPFVQKISEGHWVMGVPPYASTSPKEPLSMDLDNDGDFLAYVPSVGLYKINLDTCSVVRLCPSKSLPGQYMAFIGRNIHIWDRDGNLTALFHRGDGTAESLSTEKIESPFPSWKVYTGQLGMVFNSDEKKVLWKRNFPLNTSYSGSWLAKELDEALKKQLLDPTQVRPDLEGLRSPSTIVSTAWVRLWTPSTYIERCTIGFKSHPPEGTERDITKTFDWGVARRRGMKQPRVWWIAVEHVNNRDDLSRVGNLQHIFTSWDAFKKWSTAYENRRWIAPRKETVSVNPRVYLDETPSLSAQDAVNSSDSQGDVLLSPGIYNHPLVIRGKRALTIHAPWGPAIFRIQRGAGPIISIENSEVITLVNIWLEFEPSATDGAPDESPLVISNSMIVYLDHLYIDSGTGDGIKIRGVRGFRMENSIVSADHCNFVFGDSGDDESNFFGNLFSGAGQVFCGAPLWPPFLGNNRFETKGGDLTVYLKNKRNHSNQFGTPEELANISYPPEVDWSWKPQ